MATKVYAVNDWEHVALGHPRLGPEVKYLGPAFRRNGEPMKRLHGGRYVGYSRLGYPGGVMRARRNDLIEIEVSE